MFRRGGGGETGAEGDRRDNGRTKSMHRGPIRTLVGLRVRVGSRKRERQRTISNKEGINVSREEMEVEVV